MCKRKMGNQFADGQEQSKSEREAQITEHFVCISFNSARIQPTLAFVVKEMETVRVNEKGITVMWPVA